MKETEIALNATIEARNMIRMAEYSLDPSGQMHELMEILNGMLTLAVDRIFLLYREETA